MSCFDQTKNLCFCFANEDKREYSCINYVCKYCGRKFLSGRALGGHRRAQGSGVSSDTEKYTNLHEKLELLSQTSIGEGDACRKLGSLLGVNTVVNSSDSRGLSCRSEEDDNTVRQLNISTRNLVSLPSTKRDEDPEVAEEDNQYDVHEEAEEDEYEDVTSMKASASSSRYGKYGVQRGDEAVAEHRGDYVVHQTSDLDNVELYLHDKAHHSQLHTLRIRNSKPRPEMAPQYGTSDVAPQIPSTKMSCLNVLAQRGHACTECGKEFASWKALFGHMRCHPEREWRGIQRPVFQGQEKPLRTSTLAEINGSGCKKNIMLCHQPEKANPKQGNSDSNNDSESIEAVASMYGDQDSVQSAWMRGKRSKRSRQAVKTLPAVMDNAARFETSDTSNDIMDDADMANCLVMLASASRSNQELSPFCIPKMKKISIASRSFDRRSVSSNVDHKRSQLRIRDDNYYHADAVIRDDQPRQPYGTATIVEKLGEGQSHAGKDRFKTKLIRDNIADDSSFCEGMDEEEIISDYKGKKAKYECATCKRIFKSHQALGGHRASHKKVKGCFARNLAASDSGESASSRPEEDITDEDLVPYSDEERFSSRYGQQMRNEINEKETTSYTDIFRKSGLNKKRHECSICQRVFPSGQALGGHKRCHWEGVRLPETRIIPTSGSISHSHTKEAVAVSHALKMRIGKGDNLKLDLNMPAPADDDYQNNIFSRDYQVSVAIPQLNQLSRAQHVTDRDDHENVTMTKTIFCGQVSFRPRLCDAVHQRLTSSMSSECSPVVPCRDDLKHIEKAADRQEGSFKSKERVAVHDST